MKRAAMNLLALRLVFFCQIAQKEQKNSQHRYKNPHLHQHSAPLDAFALPGKVVIVLLSHCARSVKSRPAFPAPVRLLVCGSEHHIHNSRLPRFANVRIPTLGAIHVGQDCNTTPYFSASLLLHFISELTILEKRLIAMVYRILATLALCGFSYSFAASVATVSSTGSVTVSGVRVPTERLISWPISATDEIVTTNTPAVIRFSDGSRLTVQRNSSVRLQASASKFTMVTGAAIYDAKSQIAPTVAPSKTSVNMSTAMGQIAALSRPVGASSSRRLVAATSSNTGRLSLRDTTTTTTPSGPTLTLADGTILHLTAIQQINGITQYAVTSIQVPVEVPGQSTPTYLTVPLSNSTTAGQINSSLTINVLTTPGVDNPAQFTVNGFPGNSFTQALQTAENNTLAAAEASGTVPTGSTVPPPSTTGNLGTIMSSSAP